MSLSTNNNFKQDEIIKLKSGFTLDLNLEKSRVKETVINDLKCSKLETTAFDSNALDVCLSNV